AEDREFTDLQLSRFEAHLAELEARGVRPALRHAANSAGTIAHPRARFDMVRTGIALYGELPHPSMAAALATAGDGAALRPVMSLRSQVVAVRRLDAGERPSYGRLRPLPEASTVATVPVGYADGVPRRLFDNGGEVLIGGRRRPLAGAVTMDQIVVDCGADDVAVGDEVVLIGPQGDGHIGASEWAERLGTISYEVLTGIGPRVPRVVSGVKKASWRHWLGPAAR
ncbi:MAG: alanine racemase, partial [Acidimicrobiales bacterium]